MSALSTYKTNKLKYKASYLQGLQINSGQIHIFLKDDTTFSLACTKLASPGRRKRNELKDEDHRVTVISPEGKTSM